MKKLNIFFCLIGCLIISGCTLGPERIQNARGSEDLIAQDMVSVLVQIAELSTATIRLNIPHLRSVNDPFSSALTKRFRDAGYTVHTTGSESGELVVSYDLAQRMDPRHGAVLTYTLSIGPISLRRAYVYADNRQVRPLAPMQIKGVSAVGLRLNNQLFKKKQPVSRPLYNVVVKRDATVPDASLELSSEAGMAADALSLFADV